MTAKEPVTFDGARDFAIEIAKATAGRLGKRILLVRDLRGKIRALLPLGRTDLDPQILAEFQNQLSSALGAYGYLPPERGVLFGEDLSQADRPDWKRDVREVFTDDKLTIGFLDRQIVAHDWSRGVLQRRTKNPRVTFFAIKGGVGRSTALVNWAWRCARGGKRVLIFDLDLEAPGVSSTLLPAELMPDFGIVDWFVEDAVGQAAVVEPSMIASSPLTRLLPGDALVVPAYGRKTGDYLAKYARCYAEFSGGRYVPLAERMHHLVETFEEREQPDVVVLDSRSGLHDIAAILVTRLQADALLFAVDSSQTWAAYSFLFAEWRQHPQVREFRKRLQIVAGMVPETGRDQYLRRFRERAWDLFRDHLYDEARPEDGDAFSFDVNDEEAPHYPLPIFWHRALQDFEPARSEAGIDARTAEEALGVFMEGLDRLVFAGAYD